MKLLISCTVLERTQLSLLIRGFFSLDILYMACMAIISVSVVHFEVIVNIEA